MKRSLTEIEAFRAHELLLQRATLGLSDAEAAELAALGADDDVSFDLAAAAIDIATVPIEPMPAGVADKVLIAAGVGARPSASLPTTLAGVMPPRPAASEPIAVPGSATAAPVIPIRRSRTPAIVAIGALAAGIAIAIGAIVWASRQPPEVVVEYRDRVIVPATPSAAEARARLLATAADVETLAWTATADPAAQGARGDVVWSPSKQEGYMRFVGLAANDPAKTQYQLWIFDPGRDDKFPVDGGVFDVGPGGEVIVKISPKLVVQKPTLFAVTVEVPGGVVVSRRERIVVTAAPPKTG